MDGNIETLAGLTEESSLPRPFTPTGQEWLDKRFPSPEKGYKFWLCKSPIRSFVGCDLPDSLTAAEKGHMYECSMLLEPTTNMLFHRVNDVRKPLSVAALGKRIHMSPTQCYRFVKKMIDLRIMAREQGRLYVSPIYFFRGTYLRAHLFHLFEEDLASVLPQWVVDRFNGRR